ncbi:MAG: RimK family alpha-L-glutamate ligase [Deltaproteobacteria bacterium]|nr:RimK family alpha-L-glutamate ligase [Deltaproteobacteria bacterium]
MRILVLSRNAALYSTSRLVLVGRDRGHEVDVVDPLEIQIVVARGAPRLSCAGQRLPRYHAVIPRIGASITRYGLSVLQELEDGRAAVTNGAAAIALSRDKVRSLAVLAKKRVPVPATVCLRSVAGTDAALAVIGGPPAVIKLQHGTQGVGTMIAESSRALHASVETFCAMGQELVLQQYLREARGRDIRVVVVDGRVVAAMRRVAPKGEFRSNLHRGGSAELVTLPRRYRNCAVKAAKLIGLGVSGVDLLETRNGPVVIELNSSPGLEGIESVTKIDVATPIIALAEGLAEQQKGKSPGQQRTRKGRGG